ncbi:hypothetical protein OG21DRAFT_1415345 [Imleria badia]|nr:hypothetical protein OG21DRAFT_1415345 [Imleria badia]
MAVPHSSRWAGLKDYISQREIRHSRRAATALGEDTPSRSIIHSWSNWAGQKIRSNSTDVATIDEVHLVPGWATKHPRSPTPDEPESESHCLCSIPALIVLSTDAFDVVLHISGFATSRRIPEFLTRSQRAFLKLARGFASIPKLHPIPSLDTEPQDYSELLHLPPRPDEIPDDFEVDNLDTHFRNSRNLNHEADDINLTPQLVPADPIPAELARLHENLESRLKLFWASSLPSRRIQVSVFLQPPDSKSHRHSLRPLLTQEILTGPDGHFSGTFRIDWNDICTLLAGTCITSNQAHIEHELLVEALIINTERMPELHETPTNTIHIPVTLSIVRLISDIDDTVKVSRVVDGARAIFKQVFVKDLEDTVIPGMGEWYDTMWKRGVSFHYVSNSPYELLPVINQFISISKLPRGSIRLRSYARRSLFKDLLSAPAVRKRGNVVEVLDQFPESHFLLVGDSGEQDLELYSSLAAERPGQIIGVFIRDVGAVGLEDPTGLNADVGLYNSPTKSRTRGTTMPFPSSLPPRTVPKRAASDTDVSSSHPGAIHIPRPTRKESHPPTSYSFEPSPDLKLLSRVSEDFSSSSITSSGSSLSSSGHSTHQVRPVTEGERRRWDLQNRVNKARSVIPSHIMLRVFADPKDCLEAEQIIQRLMYVS